MVATRRSLLSSTDTGIAHKVATKATLAGSSKEPSAGETRKRSAKERQDVSKRQRSKSTIAASKTKSSSTLSAKNRIAKDSSPPPSSTSLPPPSTPSLKRAATSLLERPAGPHATNAPLVTPHGSRLVAYQRDEPDLSPSKTGLPRPTTDTRHILNEACAHLIRVDPKMKPLIDQHYCRVFCPEGLAEVCDPFRNLCSGIMAQQVSGAAAASIKRKFVGLFSIDTDVKDGDDSVGPFPSPEQVAACSVPFLRQAGLSERKAEYIQGLAQKFASGELSAQMLIKASDEEVLEKLIAVRGLGRWSVEMFACFGLKRLDILSTGDLGVQRGMAAFMGKDVSKLKAKGGGKWKYMSEEDMLKHSEKFAPYRSVFMWYMWRVEGVDVSVVEKS